MKTQKKPIKHGASLLTDFDVYLFKEGNNFKMHEKFGSHITTHEGEKGVQFTVWAPNAKHVSVIGDFNGWDPRAHPLTVRWDSSGIWEGFIPHLDKGTVYKYHIVSNHHHYKVDKGDPFAFLWEVAPKTASVVWDLDYQWNDGEWMKHRGKKNALDAPYSIYEVHLGSWKRVAEENNRSLSYKEIAHELAEYVKKMGFTHIELMPVMEHPFFGSWGYQIAGYFAPTSRFGIPQDFMYFVDYMHKNGIGVIIDWVPSHFPGDAHGLSYFDGTHLYEHMDPKKGFHPEWSSYIFNYGRSEVREFLISNALFWLEKYHVDGIRVDAVASMIYLDYSRKEGEWIPNKFGGRENIEAIDFLKKFNEVVYKEFPDVQTIAEESTAWPMVTKPVYLGGLGFGMKWNMGWMHDTLVYFSKDPIHRKYHQNVLTFSIWYSFFENFLLPLSHDEVVYGKGSLLNKMPCDDWQKLANLRALFGYQYGHPGKKLLFMGAEFGQWREWIHDQSLDWHLLNYDRHQGIMKWLADLNYFYKKEPALFENDFDNSGFEWIDIDDWQNSIISFVRKGKTTGDMILVVCNLTPVPRENYRLGVPKPGFWQEMLNSNAEEYGGSGQGNYGGVEAEKIPSHGREYSLSLVLPPLSAEYFKRKECK